MSKLAVSLLIGAALAGSFGSTLGQAKRGLAGLGKELGDGLEKGVAKARLGQALAKDLQAAQRRIHEVQGAASRALQPNPRIKTALAEAHLAYRKVTEEAKKYNLTLTDGARDAARFAAEERKLGQAMQAHARMGQALAARDAVTERRGELRGQLLGAVGMGAMVAFPLRSAMAFEDVMADVKKVVNFETPDGLAKLEAQLKGMAREIPVSLEGLAQIAAAGGQLGVAESALPEFVRTTATMSTAFGMAADQAGDAAAKLANVWGVPITGVRKMGDAINHLSDNTAAKAGEMVEVMGRIGGTARMFGLAESEAAALSAAMLALGAAPEVAATGINAVLMKLKTATMQPKAFQKAMAGLGVSSRQLERDLSKDPQGGLLRFLERIKALSKDDQLKALSGLFGMEYADDMARLVGGMDEYKKALGLVAEESRYTGSMQREFANRSQTTSNALQLLKNRVAEIGVTLGGLFLPALSEAFDSLGESVSAVADFAQAHPELSKAIARTVGGLLAFKAASIGLGYALTFVTGPLHSLRAGMALLQTMRLARAAGGLSSLARAVPALGGLTSAFGSLGGVLPVVLGGVKAIGAALFASPIGIAVAALAGAALLVWKYWGPIKSFFTGLWEGISSAAAPAAAAIGSALAPLGAMLAPVWDTIKDLGSAIGDFFGGDIFGSLFAQDAAPSAEAQHMGQRIGAALVNGVKFVFMNFTPVGLAIQAFGPVYEFVSTLGTRMARAWDAVVAKAQAAWTGVGQFFTGLGQTMAGIWDSVLAGLAAVPGQIQAVLGQALQFLSSIDLSGAGARLIQTFISGITSMAGAAYDAVKGVLSKIPGLFNNSDAKEGPLSNVTHQGGMLVQTLGAGIRGIGAGPLVDPLGQHLDAVATLLRAAPGLTAGVGTGVGAGSGSSGSPGAPGGPGAFGGPDSPGGGLTIHYAPQITVQSSGQGAGQDVAGGIAQALAQDKEALARLIRELLHQERRLSYA
jgi:TP901 family phage tail tape measure protein